MIEFTPNHPMSEGLKAVLRRRNLLGGPTPMLQDPAPTLTGRTLTGHIPQVDDAGDLVLDISGYEVRTVEVVLDLTDDELECLACPHGRAAHWLGGCGDIVGSLAR